MPARPNTTDAETLADYTSETLIIPNLRGHDMATAMQELTHALRIGGHIADALAFYHAATNMEFLHSSAMTCGIAFPHVRSPNVAQVCFALGRAAAPIMWKGGNVALPVRLVFLLALPATEASDYISAVLSLGGLPQNTELVARLLAASTSTEMLALLRGVRLALPRGKRRVI